MTRSSQGSSEGLRSLVNFDTASAADRETSRSRSSKRRTMSGIAAGSPVWLMRANVLILCFAGLSQKETGLCSASMSDFVPAPSALCIQSDCIVITLEWPFFSRNSYGKEAFAPRRNVSDTLRPTQNVSAILSFEPLFEIFSIYFSSRRFLLYIEGKISPGSMEPPR